MLTHTAGFAPALGEDYDAISAKEYADLVFSMPLNHKPGEEYDYSNVGYSMLGIIVERVSGMGYEKFLRENLWLPAKMNRTGYQFPNFTKEELAVGYRNGNRWGTAIDRPWMLDGPSWHLRANGGVLSTVGDMYRWYQALTKSTVLPKTETDKLFVPYVREDPDGKSNYGYGWVIQYLDGNSMVWHNGGNGAYNANMTFFPRQNICVVVSSNSNNKISDDIALRVLSILLNKPEMQPKQQEFTYKNHPVAMAIYEEVMDKGPATFKADNRSLLKNAGFDFKDDMLLLGAGEKLLEERRWEEGQALYEVYTELFPNIVVAWNHLGKCRDGLGDTAGAKTAWEQSVKLRPKDNPASKWLEALNHK
jgi:CubicO group peptidase (beta-lactamase class C family)